ncbi:hypothetical protein [Candidatus Nitrososphaera gargensis]|uniref:hypothetical protein n=1 Tax=Candidatus Nitrososphaera gargensis TaxID=497727 RepID=UPI0011E571B6|nr:hypothetical protein [Candidatus Nitrososphaera gargensis]
MRADTVLLKPTKEQEQELERIALHTSLLWNEANYQRRQAFLNKKKIPQLFTPVQPPQTLGKLQGDRHRQRSSCTEKA